MFFAMLMFGEPGVEIMYPNPGFPIYESMIKFTGATPVPIALREENGFAFSAEEVLGQITPKTRLIIINIIFFIALKLIWVSVRFWSGS